MGGRAFIASDNSGNVGLCVPRMSPLVYNFISRYVEAVLLEVFTEARVVCSGPWKESFGDVDVIATGFEGRNKQTGDLPSKIQRVKELLGVERAIISHGGNLFQGAVPFSVIDYAAFFLAPDMIPLARALDDLVKESAYFQVDLHIHSTKEDFDYDLLRSRYGDATNLLNLTLRPLGFLLTDKGFTVAIEDMLQLDRPKPRRVVLSKSADRIEEFLGIRHEGRFETKEELFLWVTQSRYFQPVVLKRGFKPSRLLERSLIREFVFDWWPANEERISWNEHWQHTAQDDAAKFFDKQDELECISRNFQTQDAERSFWLMMRLYLPIHPPRSDLAIRALRNWVDMGPTTEPAGRGPIVREVAETDPETRPVWTVDSTWDEFELIKWGQDNFAPLMVKERRRQKDLREAKKAITVTLPELSELSETGETSDEAWMSCREE